MTAEEWEARCQLAACYQLVDLYGMSDMASNHITARVPGPDHYFLVNRFGMLFDEITASSLIKVDLEGRILDDSVPGELSPTGFTIHSAIHAARPDLACVLHTHTRANVAASIQKEGLLPLTQRSLQIMSYLSYHDYEGIALDLDERSRIVKDLGEEGRILLLRNHGAVTVGRTIAEAFVWMYKLETACQYQLDGLSSGRELVWLSEESVAKTIGQGRKVLGYGGIAETGKLEWKALVRKLERIRGNSYRT